MSEITNDVEKVFHFPLIVYKLLSERVHVTQKSVFYDKGVSNPEVRFLLYNVSSLGQSMLGQNRLGQLFISDLLIAVEIC